MSRINYIISVSAKCILPDGEIKGMDKLCEKFGTIQEFYLQSLSQGRIDEKTYGVIRDQNNPLTPKEVKELKTIFDAEKRVLEVYRLEKI